MKNKIGQILVYNGFGKKVGTKYQITGLSKTKTSVSLHEILPNKTLDTNGFWLNIQFINDDGDNSDWLTYEDWTRIRKENQL